MGPASGDGLLVPVCQTERERLWSSWAPVLAVDQSALAVGMEGSYGRHMASGRVGVVREGCCYGVHSELRGHSEKLSTPFSKSVSWICTLQRCQEGHQAPSALN